MRPTPSPGPVRAQRPGISHLHTFPRPPFPALLPPTPVPPSFPRPVGPTWPGRSCAIPLWAADGAFCVVDRSGEEGEAEYIHMASAAAAVAASLLAAGEGIGRGDE